MLTNIMDLLAEAQEEAIAIAAPGRSPITYARLRQHLNETVHTLNTLGIGRRDRVAMVLPNGPEMATAFLAVTATATAAPLNPAYRAEEFDFYMSDLNVKAIIVEAGRDTPAIAVARARGIAVLELTPRSEEQAGLFSLQGAATEPTLSEPTQRTDIALILHTSGTTSRPKIVPLSQHNLCASAGNIVKALALSAADCCLSVMPLFHIHGLMAGLLAPLAAGGSVFCTPGFNALKFFSWLEEAHPTWYTAVPTMHQAILARASRNQETIARTQLRFIRSSSATLPPQVFAKLEQVFAAPVIEAYSMTEAAHQMTSNPLPPQVRSSGSVGLPAGPEVAILDSEGNQLPHEMVGEVGIRGDNVMGGYENNPQANAAAFSNGWFRTGDQGVIDTDGYLRLTGRLKELINRGGEKVSPREVDEVLMEHPGVAIAVTFALPHDKLGEDVAVAVVLREGGVVSEQELRTFASARLADFKVPRRVVFVEQIPTGPTGKLQRIGLAQRLELSL
ncbi:MAG: AMP-binding protein [Chroococcidiopsidaceae cyanobacterium CP_BM_ER_R8_30]|nr:AMP-binding protein [Chroococcidiopsidaceae cyanobacterium CP_BM_ER_R8_30]